MAKERTVGDTKKGAVIGVTVALVAGLALAALLEYTLEEMGARWRTNSTGLTLWDAAGYAGHIVTLLVLARLGWNYMRGRYRPEARWLGPGATLAAALLTGSARAVIDLDESMGGAWTGALGALIVLYWSWLIDRKPLGIQIGERQALWLNLVVGVVVVAATSHLLIHHVAGNIVGHDRSGQISGFFACFFAVVMVGRVIWAYALDGYDTTAWPKFLVLLYALYETFYPYFFDGRTGPFAVAGAVYVAAAVIWLRPNRITAADLIGEQAEAVERGTALWSAKNKND